MNKQTALRLGIGLLALAGMASCRTETPDGRIPSDYVGEVQTVVGDYTGRMETGSSGKLSIRLDGTRVVARFNGALLGRSCAAKIGQLTSVNGRSGRLSSANFYLSGASCVEGNTISLSVSQDRRTIYASVLQESRTVETCPDQWQVMSCQRKAQDAYFKCDQDAGRAEYEYCRKDADADYARCDDCSRTTVGTYIRGAFSR